MARETDMVYCFNARSSDKEQRQPLEGLGYRQLGVKLRLLVKWAMMTVERRLARLLSMEKVIIQQKCLGRRTTWSHDCTAWHGDESLMFDFGLEKE